MSLHATGRVLGGLGAWAVAVLAAAACATPATQSTVASSRSTDPCGEAARPYRCLQAQTREPLLDPAAPEQHPALRLVALLRDYEFVTLLPDGRLTVAPHAVDYAGARHVASSDALRATLTNNMGVRVATLGELDSAAA